MVTKNENLTLKKQISPELKKCFCPCTSNEKHHSIPTKGNFRLSSKVLPLHYIITLDPDLTNFTFNGSVEINLNLNENTNIITLNSKDLEIHDAYIMNNNGTSFNGCIELEPETEMAHISFNGHLGMGQWVLKLNFTGTLNDSLKGFYRSCWTDANGNKQVVATTQFESTDARRCFPCFDEPEFKATYKVYLTVDENLIALSNEQIIKTERIAGTNKKIVEFATTIKMSTYLLAFIVGNFESSDPVFVNGKELRIWANPSKKHLMNFGLKSASHAVAWFEEYYGIPYPGGNKIDFIAIADFAAGAMENLGCITFRETALLVDENTATQGELERVAEVVMHELAHMWFGDLVTMKWWNGLWLNESFATFMENKALSDWRPAWKIWDKFAISRAAASRVDALKSTHPIECPVVKPEEAAELFDVISYEKGCSTLYQIEQFMGEEIFRTGISKYLKKHAYANTQTHELWDSLEEAAQEAKLNVPIRKIMDNWVFTAGHPVLKVEKAKDMDGFIKISQNEFKYLENKESKTLWFVPVTLSVTSQGKQNISKFVLDAPSQTIFVGENYDYITVNAGGSGFYRVAYASDLLQMICQDLSRLSVVERFNLVNDTWACVKGKVISVIDYLNMLQLFTNETDPSVWAIILGSLKSLETLLDKGQRKPFAKMVTQLLQPAFNKLSYEAKANETVQTKQLRGSLIGALGTIGASTEVQLKANELFGNWLKDKASIDANILPALVTILAYNGNNSRYDEFKEIFKSAKNPQDVNRFMYSLTEFQDQHLINKTLESCINGDFRSQDAPYVIQRLLNNETAMLTTWNFIKDNWDKLIKSYPANGVVRMVGGVSALDTSKDLLNEVKEFFAKHPVEAGSMALAQAQEQQLINYEARNHHTPALMKHFSLKA